MASDRKLGEATALTKSQIKFWMHAQSIVDQPFKYSASKYTTIYTCSDQGQRS